MRIKKSGGKIFGADFTAAERKAMDKEIQRQLADYTEKHRLELDAMILWVLHAQLGLGPTRLRRFYDQFEKELDALLERYEMGEDDRLWLFAYMLKQIGVDIEKWDRERD